MQIPVLFGADTPPAEELKNRLAVPLFVTILTFLFIK